MACEKEKFGSRRTRAGRKMRYCSPAPYLSVKWHHLNVTFSRVSRDGFVLDAFVLFGFHPRLRDNAFLTPRQGWGSEIRSRQDSLIACSWPHNEC